MRASAPYRPDVDGLRALAIILVVAFHAFPSVAPGGFVGVDVFFVISGYLISLIILDRLDAGTFSFTNFYARRIRRIFPALAIVLLACVAWGWFSLFASDFGQLGKHVAGGAGFASNLLLWGEAGYFDVASGRKPLLHLWSLGIEEQFYLLWPALLSIAWRGRQRVFLAIAAVLVISFLINVVQVRTDEVAAFYSPVTRLWELSLGGMLAYATLARTHDSFAMPWIGRAWHVFHPRFADVTAIVGLFAVLGSAVLFNAETSFPGWRAALPTGGTLLLVASGPDAWLNRRVLAWPALVWLGLISYPLYLWHWPLLSFAYLDVGLAPPAVRIGLIVASLLLAWSTYVVIERPIRFQWRGRAPIAAVTVLMVAIGSAGYAIFASEGFYDRPINRSDQAHFLEYYETLRKRGLSDAYRAECDFMDWQTETTRASIAASCTAAGTRSTVFLWGDSHAQALSYGIRAILPADTRLAQVTSSACPPRLHEADPATLGGRCATTNAYALERIAALKPEVVVLAQILAHQATDWSEVAQAIRARGAARVVLVGPVPEWLPTLPAVIVKHYWGQNYDRVDRGLHPEMFETDRILRERYPIESGIEYVSLIGALCNDDGCVATVPGDSKQLLVIDNGHLSPTGSRYVADRILRPYLVGE